MPPEITSPFGHRMFRLLGIAASGLSAQRARMETIAGNIANAGTTRTPAGGAYRRRMVELDAATEKTFAERLNGARELVPADIAVTDDPAIDSPTDTAFGVHVRGITEDMSDGPRVYQPGHPDADADGYVTYPNVKVTEEMVDLMDARRLFEANATVFQTAKALLRRSIDI
jgi:flagellar basal-body rod protein FlgC